jgi:uncharacterized membrane protein
MPEPLITNDAVVFGIIMALLAMVFYSSSSSHPLFKKFYKYVPSLVLCYFLPGLLTTLGVISPERSQLYQVASRYLLPASLVLFTLSVDLPGIARLGKKAVILFFTGTASVILGGPLVLKIFSLIDADILSAKGADATWRGMATMAGSWIGGAANQAALREVFRPSNELFAGFVTVDVLIGNLWTAFLLFGAARSVAWDARSGADTSAITALQQKTSQLFAKSTRIPTLADLMGILAVGFFFTGVAHASADILAPWIQRSAPQLEKFSLTSGFFWVVVIATALGIAASFTRLRNLEGAGASRIGSVLLYILIASVGMGLDLRALFRITEFFLIGFFWISFHAAIMLLVGKLLRAPFFFVAVSSEANIGGAASAPVVAAAFHPTLAPVGVLLAVLGYAVGTYGGWLCGILMQAVR